MAELAKPTGRLNEYHVYREGDFYRTAANEAQAKAICRVESREGRRCRWEAVPCDPCAICGRAAPFDVAWLIPARKDDHRPVCSSACAAKAV